MAWGARGKSYSDAKRARRAVRDEASAKSNLNTRGQRMAEAIKAAPESSTPKKKPVQKALKQVTGAVKKLGSGVSKAAKRAAIKKQGAENYKQARLANAAKKKTAANTGTTTPPPASRQVKYTSKKAPQHAVGAMKSKQVTPYMSKGGAVKAAKKKKK